MKLRQLGEDRLLERLLPQLKAGDGVVAGAGDDVAVVKGPGAKELLLLKTDCLVERVHYNVKAGPEAIGWKAMMRPLSDFAAVSGLPRFALVTLVVSKETQSNWVEKLYRGLNRAAKRFQVSIVGGVEWLAVVQEVRRDAGDLDVFHPPAAAASYGGDGSELFEELRHPRAGAEIPRVANPVVHERRLELRADIPQAGDRPGGTGPACRRL